MADGGHAFPKLLKFAKSGDLTALQGLINSELKDTNWSGYYAEGSGDTVLTLAARYGHLEILQYLGVMKVGDTKYAVQVDFEQRNFDGKTPLHEAAQQGHSECVQYLLASGVDVDPLKRACWTPLMLACTKSKLDVIRILVEHGAKLTVRNKDGWNIFHVACREGHTDILNYLLTRTIDDSEWATWDTASKNWRTPLHTAALHGKTEAVHTLLTNCRYNINAMDKCGNTALMDSLRAGFTQTAKLLLKHKADMNSEDVLGRPCLHLAAQAGHIESLKLIIEHSEGCDIDKAAPDGSTALHCAAKEGMCVAVLYLLSRGANVDVRDAKGRTAADVARIAGYYACVSALTQQLNSKERLVNQ